MGREDGAMNKYRGSRHTRGKSEAALVIPGAVDRMHFTFLWVGLLLLSRRSRIEGPETLSCLPHLRVLESTNYV